MDGYKLPKGLPPRLDLRVPPADPRRAENYSALVDLLEELGATLEIAAAGAPLRRWETRVLRLLEDGEIDEFMRPSGESYDPANAAATRWLSLKRLLLKRKGLDGAAGADHG